MLFFPYSRSHCVLIMWHVIMPTITRSCCMLRTVASCNPTRETEAPDPQSLDPKPGNGSLKKACGMCLGGPPPFWRWEPFGPCHFHGSSFSAQRGSRRLLGSVSIWFLKGSADGKRWEAIHFLLVLWNCRIVKRRNYGACVCDRLNPRLSSQAFCLPRASSGW